MEELAVSVHKPEREGTIESSLTYNDMHIIPRVATRDRHYG